MKPDRLAIVRVPEADQVRPAAFVFPDAAGVTWVEPSYRDPVPATAPAVHRVEGQAVARADGFDVVAGEQVRATVRPVETAEDDPDGSCARALADFADLLVADGVSLEEERRRVAAELELLT